MNQSEIDEQVAHLLDRLGEVETQSLAWERTWIGKRLLALGLPPSQLLDFLHRYESAATNREAPPESGQRPRARPDIGAFLALRDPEEEGIAVRSPVETARDEVCRDTARLAKTFPDKSARLTTGIALKASLRKLEQTAARCDYERLSRVAAVLHDTLKHNPIEGFHPAELHGFLEACRQITENRPAQADPYLCEKALFAVGLSWLAAFLPAGATAP